MALIDQFDRRALALASLPIGVFVVLLVRCLLAPSVGLAAATPFAGVLLLSYAPLACLGLFRAWGDLWSNGAETTQKRSQASWGPTLERGWRQVSYSGLHIFGTLWIAHMHWGLVDHAKEKLRVPPASDIVAFLRHLEPPPRGLALFGESLTIMGIVVPLVFIGLMWLILPGRP